MPRQVAPDAAQWKGLHPSGTDERHELHSVECTKIVQKFELVGGELQVASCRLQVAEREEGFGGAPEEGRGDGAFGNGNEVVGAAAAVAGIAVGIEGEADAVAVCPGRGGEHGDLSGRGHAAAREGFAQDRLFEMKLRFVTRVQILAAAAGAVLAIQAARAARIPTFHGTVHGPVIDRLLVTSAMAPMLVPGAGSTLTVGVVPMSEPT